MIRTLTIIAGASALVSAASLGAAVAITGPAAIAHGAWSWGPGGWGSRGDASRSGVHWGVSWSDERTGDDETATGGPSTTRTLPWTGGSAFTSDLDAEVDYTPAAGPGKVTLIGPKALVDQVTLADGVLRYADDGDHGGRLKVMISAPLVERFTLEGSGALSLHKLHQDHLTIALDGDGDAHAEGAVKAVTLTASGSGDIDAGALKADSAQIRIEGSGAVRAAPTNAAEVEIAGSGDVTLLTDPPKLKSRIEGSGELKRG
jgi:hypothetical protein